MADKVRVTAARGLNVREGPGTQHKRVGALPHGQVVEVIERRGVWGEIRSPVAGWIHLGYTEAVDDEPGEWVNAHAVDLSLWNRVTGLFWATARPWVLILKATQGVHILDPRFGERWARARFLDWRRWAYHFYDPRFDGLVQAAVFVRVTGVQRGERAMLDLEWYPPEGKQAWAANQVQVWIDAVEETSGKAPVIYTRKDVWEAYFGAQGDAEIAARCPLMVADYRGADEPLMVPGWERVALWQYTSRGRWPGVSGRVDLSRVARWFDEQEG